MILTLQVVGERAKQMGNASRKVFKSIGGTIGRLADNDWVFADPYVSGRHALIRYVNGKYFIEDTSTNGVFINSPENRLQRAQPHPLKHGDRLFIDAYEIEVTIEKDPAAKAQRDPFDPNALAAPGRPLAPHEDDRTASLVMSDIDDLDDSPDLDEFEDEGAANATEWFGASEVRAKPQAAAPSAPRAPAPSAASAPPAPSSAAISRPATRPAATAQPAARAAIAQSSTRESLSSDDGLETLLNAAGIEGVAPSSELAQVLGDVLRNCVAGVMEVLRARERMKDELRMRGTTFKPINNNPLKFSANVDDAFHNLFVKHNAAYLAPADAVDDAFRDVRDHQAALLIAMRLAFEALLAQFDPVRLQEEFDRQLKKGSILGVPAKLRYWDLYRERYGEMVKDADASFRQLFGEEFAKAYEEQLARLRALGNS